MKEKILAKIVEMQNENSDLSGHFIDLQEGNRWEYFDDYGGDFIAGGYNGDSLSHMIDILIEQNHALDKLYKFIEKLDMSEDSYTLYRVFLIHSNGCLCDDFELNNLEEAIEIAKEYKSKGYEVYIRKEEEFIYE